MQYLSVCSGIEAATVAWHPLGWQPAGFSEIEPFPSAVLNHHYPDVTNYGDMTKYKEWNLGAIDLLVGGTPCQSFSVAGLRKGLDDPRGNLMLTYLAIAKQYRPKWLVWENVPGVLSSNGGHDFATFLRGMGQCGYGFAYRVLDAQYFGVAQRRRRVFVVGCLGDWRRAAAVLFERESLSGNPAPSREKRQEVAKTLTRGISQRFDAETETMIPTYALQGAGVTSQNSQGSGWNEDVCFTLNRMDVHGVAHQTPFGVSEKPDVAHCLRSGASKADKHESTTYIAEQIAVRRLTPVECERLQGFPDNYTNIPWRKQPQSPDGPRYKALGNSMAVPVMRWIGERIQQASEIT